MTNQLHPMFYWNKKIHPSFEALYQYVEKNREINGATASAVYVLKGNTIVGEWYKGYHDQTYTREVLPNSRFNVFSVRKSYIGFALSICIHRGLINHLDDEVFDYVPIETAKGITFRHIVTHTHGLDFEDGDYKKVFEPGADWLYNGAGLELLYQAIFNITGQSVAEILRENVFKPLSMKETGWVTESFPELVHDILDDNKETIRLGDSSGHEKNLFVSARDLAFWGYLQLNKGCIGDKQRLPRDWFDLIRTRQSPDPSVSIPHHSLFWWIQEDRYPQSEIGKNVPDESLQILGKSGCACLVIPEYNAVIVRMYNKRGNPPEYDYLQDINGLGDLAVSIFEKGGFNQ